MCIVSRPSFPSFHSTWWQGRLWSHCHKWRRIRARFLSLARSKLRLCSANHRAGYFSNLACDCMSIVWAYSEHDGPRSDVLRGRSSVVSMAFWMYFCLLGQDGRCPYRNGMGSKLYDAPGVCGLTKNKCILPSFQITRWPWVWTGDEAVVICIRCDQSDIRKVQPLDWHRL